MYKKGNIDNILKGFGDTPPLVERLLGIVKKQLAENAKVTVTLENCRDVFNHVDDDIIYIVLDLLNVPSDDELAAIYEKHQYPVERDDCTTHLLGKLGASVPIQDVVSYIQTDWSSDALKEDAKTIPALI